MSEPQANARRALLIGIDDYPHMTPLAGCVNDVNLMRSVLTENLGFPEKHITMLTNDQATRDGILAAFDELHEQTGEDDLVVIHYAGHGSRMTDREGDEPDGMDETIVTFDSGRDPLPNRDITDDEINETVLRLSEKTPYLTLIFDCCHSGTITRDAFGATARFAEPDDRPIDSLPPSPISTRSGRSGKREAGPSGWLPLSERYVLLAGCRDEESSYEHIQRMGDQEIRQGNLTFHLCQLLPKAAPGTTYRDVHERVSTLVAAATSSRQHPQAEGALDRELFGVRDIQPMRYVRVIDRSDNTVTLAAGAAHGMTVGSTFGIYPPGTKHVTAEAESLGTVELTNVTAAQSEAKIVAEKESGAIARDTRGFEDVHDYGDMKWWVEVLADPSLKDSGEQFRNVVENSSLLTNAESDTNGDARAYLIAAREVVAEGDPVPQLGPIEVPTWAVVGQQGRLLMPPHRADEKEVLFTLRDNLETLARYKQALAIENPDPNGVLKGRVGFKLKKQVDGGWVDPPTEQGGNVVFEEGDRIAFEITNNYEAPIFVSVLDFGITGRIDALHPVRGASEPIEPGKTIQVGMRKGEELELFLPDNFPFAPDPLDNQPPGGIETFKLFATLQEADFSFLSQASVRAADLTPSSSPSFLESLMSQATAGVITRDVKRKRQEPIEDWTTEIRTFYLKRPL